MNIFERVSTNNNYLVIVVFLPLSFFLITMFTLFFIMMQTHLSCFSIEARAEVIYRSSTPITSVITDSEGPSPNTCSPRALTPTVVRHSSENMRTPDFLLGWNKNAI